MGVTIDRVAGGKDLHRFVTLPWAVYRKDVNWVPPLITDVKKQLTKHPFHEHAEVDYFLARRDGQVVGRIAAILNRLHNEFHSERTAFFGFFEVLPDEEAARALLDHATAWARERGAETIRGPANFSSNEEWGLLVDGFDSPPVIMMTYNPARYMTHLEQAGFRKAKDLVAYLATEPPKEHNILTFDRLAERFGVVVRTLDMKHFHDEVKKVREVYNAAWERNWGFVPMTEAEFEHMAHELKPVVKPDLVVIVERQSRPVGFAMALPDYNQAIRHANGRLFPLGLLKILYHSRHIKRLRVLTLGLVPEMRRRGLDQLMYLKIAAGGKKLGITSGEFSWILEDNFAIRQALEHMGAKVYKTYRVYERETGLQAPGS